MTNEYEAIATAYDGLMYDVPSVDWAQYLLGFLEGRRNILEYGCGTGNITVELVKKGCHVIAVDRSAAMLDVAAEKLRKTGREHRLACAQMTDFKVNTQVDAAISACDCVNYLLTERDLQRFLEGARDNLKPGGILVFDISSRAKLTGIIGDNFFYDDNDENTLFWQNTYDADKELVYMDVTLFIKEGDRYRRSDERHVQRAWDVGEVSTVLEQAGFTNIAAYAFGTRNAPGSDAQRIQFYAEKGALTNE